MKLIEARVNGNPRQVSTKFGEKAVMDVLTTEGDEITIWRPAGDMDVMGRANGERVSITIDSKGKASLVEHASTKPQAAQSSNVTSAESRSLGGFRHVGAASPKEICDLSKTEQPSRSAEIADYIQRLGKLYSHCLDTAARMPKTVELETPQVKDVATTFFIQAVKHFNL
jgi:hypothetical protein